MAELASSRKAESKSIGTQKFNHAISASFDAYIVMKIFQPVKRLFDICGRFRIFRSLVAEDANISVAECPFNRWSYFLILRGKSNDMLQLMYALVDQFQCVVVPMTLLHIRSLTEGQKWVKVKGGKPINLQQRSKLCAWQL